jgi:NAD(P)-dependent dehydrogenase (short-subunit alcohol dehydrogenase family)
MSFNPFSLQNKVIVITGASSGIGRQCAIDCSKMGASVVLIGRNIERLYETLTLMEQKKLHHVLSFDLTDFKEVTQRIKEISMEVNGFHGLLNCAGISTTLPMKYVSSEKLKQYFETNVFAAYHVTKEVCKKGRFSQEGGSIVFFSSVMGDVGEIGKSLYGMTKGALVSGVKSLACELAPKKIRVNAISPGAIMTPINKDLPHMADPENRKQLEDKHLLGLGETRDVANACIYLLSDASKWVTGTKLIVDGGYTAR